MLLLFWAIVSSLVFAIVFFGFEGDFNFSNFSGKDDSIPWFTYFYYSIVTFTTLGFGDVTPKTNFGMFVIVLEVVIGYFTLGTMISVLANKIARRA